MKENFKKNILNFLIILILFFADRLSKIYVLKLAELDSVVDIYLTSYLNFYLIWNKGIAFGLLSFNDSLIYNAITIIIGIISIIVLVMAIKTSRIKKYSLLFVFAGSIGNLFDRIHYSAVPDFIDFHVNDFHWFVFNVADIFITLGIICLISAEIFFKDN